MISINIFNDLRPILFKRASINGKINKKASGIIKVFKYFNI